VTRLGELVDGLLEASRLEEGELAIHPAPGDLAAAVRAVLERIRTHAERRGVPLRAVVPAAVPACFDRVRVEQALAHLVSNALKYGQGKPVDVVLEQGERAARVTVRDRGIGVDPGERERIFGRFERAVSTRHYGGFGLGLFVARRTAEEHGGTLSVEATPEGGATFVLELPLAGPAAGLPAAAGPAPETG
jgi:two-component system OmpR family sensor kinase